MCNANVLLQLTVVQSMFRATMVRGVLLQNRSFFDSKHGSEGASTF